MNESKPAIIGYTDSFTPENRQAVGEYVSALSDSYMQEVGMDRDDLTAIIKNSMGIRNIYIEDRENEADIYCEMIERYFERTKTTPDNIDYLIYTRGHSVASGNPWHMTDPSCINVPYFLQNEFQMNHTQVFNVEQLCTGTLVAARLAYSMIGDGSARKILLLSANFFMNPENRLMGGLGLVSDGLGMMEISADGTGMEIIDFAGLTDGSITMVRDFIRGENPQKVVDKGAALIKLLVEKNNLTLDDISLIIPQNISKSGWNLYCNVLGFPKEKVFLDNFVDGGHMSDVDFIRNIHDVNKQVLLAPGQYAVIYGLGTGTSWTALLVRGTGL